MSAPQGWKLLIRLERELQGKLDESPFAQGARPNSCRLIGYTLLAYDRVWSWRAVQRVLNLAIVRAGSKVWNYARLRNEIVYVGQTTNIIEIASLDIVVGVVEQVVHLHAELEISLFRHCERLVYSEVHVPIAGLPELVATGHVCRECAIRC